jgi:hypothetical protein
VSTDPALPDIPVPPPADDTRPDLCVPVDEYAAIRGAAEALGVTATKPCGCGPLEPCARHLDRSPLPPDPLVFRDVLRAHYLADVICDHERARDNPVCACSLVFLGWHGSVGLAVEAWVDHVMAEAATMDATGPAEGNWRARAEAAEAKLAELDALARKVTAAYPPLPVVPAKDILAITGKDPS